MRKMPLSKAVGVFPAGCALATSIGALAGLLGMSSEVEAATLTAEVFNVACGFAVETNETGASVQCGNARASASPGALSVYAQAFFLSASSGFSFDSDVRASAQFRDVLSFPGLSTGSLSIPVDFSGSISFDNLLPNSNNGGSLNQTGAASGGIGNTSAFSYALAFDTFNGLTGGGTPSGITDIVIDIVDGQAFVNASIGAMATCFLFVAAGELASCSTAVNYGSTLRFLGATVFDSLGNQRDDISIIAESGFDYRKGVEPHDNGGGQVPVIPLPATGFLLMGGLASLVAFKRQSKMASPS